MKKLVTAALKTKKTFFVDLNVKFTIYIYFEK